MKKRNIEQKTFPCECTASPRCDRLTVQSLGDKDGNLDIWTDKKLKGGVYLGPKALKKLIKFLIKITK